jgi:DNA-binding transcriptional regulator/RsmH inhibitor MraZ
MARVERGEISLARQRVVSGSASVVTVDKQGRVNLDENLRNYAGLRTEQKVIVTGNFTRVEIWAPEVHDRVQAEGRSELAGAVAVSPPAATPRSSQRRERGSTRPPGTQR